jgi:phosphoribosylformylglycinamidine cyclo-ligase
VDNIPRVLPRIATLSFVKARGRCCRFFKSSEAKGGVTEDELYQVFNMGIGMTIIVSPEKRNQR